MSVPFSAVITPTTLTFVTPDGATQTATNSHSNFQAMLDVVRDINAARKAGMPFDGLMDRLMQLAEPARVITQAVEQAKASEIVQVRDGVVYHRGEPQRSVLAERIIWTVEQGHDATALMLFLEHLMENPSKRSVDQLWTFVEKHRMGLSEDGHILAYKKVNAEFRDLHSNTMDNSPGQTVEMPRNRVSDDPNDTCSDGLHACAIHYLSSYGFGADSSNRTVLVKINPRDVVSVPVDANASKLRCCRYVVLSEYLGGMGDMLGSRPTFRDEDVRPHGGTVSYPPPPASPDDDDEDRGGFADDQRDYGDEDDEREEDEDDDRPDDERPIPEDRILSTAFDHDANGVVVGVSVEFEGESEDRYYEKPENINMILARVVSQQPKPSAPPTDQALAEATDQTIGWLDERAPPPPVVPVMDAAAVQPSAPDPDPVTLQQLQQPLGFDPITGEIKVTKD